MSDSCIASYTCGTPNSGIRGDPNALAGFGELISHIVLPCSALMQGKKLNLFSIRYAMLC